MKVSRRNIWNCRQNKPTHIVRDLLPHIAGAGPGQWRGADLIYRVLLSRGVFKWLAVRRDLIRLKNQWKERLKLADESNVYLRRTGNGYRAAYMKGYRQALRECRTEVRALCHSDRWQAPDNDRTAQRWLENLDAEIDRPAPVGSIPPHEHSMGQCDYCERWEAPDWRNWRCRHEIETPALAPETPAARHIREHGFGG
jgi:hypothetical protein